MEGFSNPLWTLLFVPQFWLNSDLPLWLAKFLGYAFSFGTFLFGFQIVVRISRAPLFGCLAMTFLALNMHSVLNPSTSRYVNEQVVNIELRSNQSLTITVIHQLI